MNEIVEMMADSIQLDHLTLDQLKDLEKILEKIK